MKCSKRQDLVLYYYGELDEPEEKRLASHLEACGKCSAAWQRLKEELEGLHCEPPEMPESYWRDYQRGVRNKIGKRSPRRFFFPARPLLQGAITAMLLAAVATAGFHYYRGKQDRIMILQNYELLSELDLLEDFDLLRSLEEVENL